MKRLALRVGVLTLALTFFVAGLALAAPQSKPNGPWITPEQNVSLEGFESYEQLTAKLMQIEKRAKVVGKNRQRRKHTCIHLYPTAW
jgi:hypothetical protein